MKVIKLKCSNCGKEFNRSLSEYKNKINNRNQTNFYCSVECGIIYNRRIQPITIDKSILSSLLASGLSYVEIGTKLGKHSCTVGRWARKYGLESKFKGSCEGKKCICSICGRKYIYYRSKHHTLIKCNTCINRSYRHTRKYKLVEYKGGKCEVCGYNKSLNALEFHHLDPSIKEFNLSVYYNSQAWDIVKKEIDKCILVCANCHREIHEELHNASLV